jgi:hypothetical protein
MPSTTSPGGLIYPVPSDPIAPLNAIFQDLAESTQEALVTVRETAAKTADYTLTLDDIGMIVVMNKSGAATLTVPADAVTEFPLGSVVSVFNLSASDVTVAGDSGVTVHNAGDIAQYGEVRLRRRDFDEWVMS